MRGHYVTRCSLDIDLFLVMVAIGIVFAAVFVRVFSNRDRIQALEQGEAEVEP